MLGHCAVRVCCPDLLARGRPWNACVCCCLRVACGASPSPRAPIRRARAGGRGLAGLRGGGGRRRGGGQARGGLRGGGGRGQGEEVRQGRVFAPAPLHAFLYFHLAAAAASAACAAAAPQGPLCRRPLFLLPRLYAEAGAAAVRGSVWPPWRPPGAGAGPRVVPPPRCPGPRWLPRRPRRPGPSSTLGLSTRARCSTRPSPTACWAWTSCARPSRAWARRRVTTRCPTALNRARSSAAYIIFWQHCHCGQMPRSTADGMRGGCARCSCRGGFLLDRSMATSNMIYCRAPLSPLLYLQAVFVLTTLNQVAVKEGEVSVLVSAPVGCAPQLAGGGLLEDSFLFFFAASPRHARRPAPRRARSSATRASWRTRSATSTRGFRSTCRRSRRPCSLAACPRRTT